MLYECDFHLVSFLEKSYLVIITFRYCTDFSSSCVLSTCNRCNENKTLTSNLSLLLFSFSLFLK